MKTFAEWITEHNLEIPKLTEDSTSRESNRPWMLPKATGRGNLPPSARKGEDDSGSCQGYEEEKPEKKEKKVKKKKDKE